MNWKGGRVKIDGYWYIKKFEHPFATKQKYVAESHLVYEHYLKILFDEDIYIPPEIDIHHENKNILDNSLINLTPLTRNEHTTHHNPKKDMSDRYCSQCGNPKTSYSQTGYIHWLKYKDGYICNKCYMYNYNRKMGLCK